MVRGVFRNIICRKGYSKKIVGKELLRRCAAGESKFTFCHFDYSFEELKYDTGIANLQGRNLKTGAYDDPPHVFMSIDKTVNGDGAESSTDNKSKQI